MTKLIFLLIFISLSFPSATSYAEPTIPGPYSAIVTSVVDGDTVNVKVRIWLGLYQEVAVRIRGIDAPEISQPKCTKEKELGLKAKEFLERMLPKGSTVNLTEIRNDKYGGRVDTSLETTDGKDIGELLLKEDLAFPYNGRKRKSWCGPES